jgi:hypothetical protein
MKGPYVGDCNAEGIRLQGKKGGDGETSYLAEGNPAPRRVQGQTVERPLRGFCGPRQYRHTTLGFRWPTNT